MEGLLLQKLLHFHRGPWALPSNPSPWSYVWLPPTPALIFQAKMQGRAEEGRRPWSRLC